MINEELLSILACPKCKGPVVYIQAPSGEPQAEERLDCAKCRLRYFIQDGIPIMLMDQAKAY